MEWAYNQEISWELVLILFPEVVVQINSWEVMEVT
jgi:hypothetical protein